MHKLEIQTYFERINKHGRTESGITRLAYTKEEYGVKLEFMKLCEEMGLEVAFDSVGNVIATLRGKDPRLPHILIGSHLDSVKNAGDYDGTVGIVVGLEVIRRIIEKNVKLNRSIELICFTAEESARFSISTIGSKFMTGTLDRKQAKKIYDRDGRTLSDAMKSIGIDIEEIDTANRSNEVFEAFYEVHIEQGPYLEKNQKGLGVVTKICAPTRLEIELLGQAAHTGTTPLEYRKDAFLAACDITRNFEILLSAQEDKVIGTVSDCIVKPGLMNVVPEKVELKVDIRGGEIALINQLLQGFIDCFKQVESDRKVKVKYKIISQEIPVRLNDEIITSFEQKCKKLNKSYVLMQSGAGHDAMNMSKLTPTGMLFIPSKDGVSHHPSEYSSIESIKDACDVLELEIMDRL